MEIVKRSFQSIYNMLKIKCRWSLRRRRKEKKRKYWVSHAMFHQHQHRCTDSRDL